ncbi:MAG: ComEC/Rec2 family competence protein, partial [Bacteroidales bacterium]
IAATPNATTAGPNAIAATPNATTAGPNATTTGSDSVSDSANTNTTTFDYTTYMARRGFFRRAYIYDFQRVSGKLTVFERLKRLRVPIARSWEGEAGALLSGICMGDKTSLTPEIRERFRVAGAGHILAVSGLHVGILYGSLVLLLGLPRQISESRRYKRKGAWRTKQPGSGLSGNNPVAIRSRELALRRTYSLIRGTWIHIPALMLIWSYAGVVGFSASVVRAALMLTIYGAGKMTGRRAFGLNVLSITALFLVILEPMNLYDIGFQMSFCAVLGLILFFPLLRNLLSVRNRILKYFWELFCCSLAVQLGTLWLTTASFGIIPLYGLLCNLAVVPFCTLILCVFLCYLIFLNIPFMSGLTVCVNDLLHLLASWLDDIVTFFAALPLTPIHYQPGTGGQILILLCTVIVYILLRKNDRNL